LRTAATSTAATASLSAAAIRAAESARASETSCSASSPGDHLRKLCPLSLIQNFLQLFIDLLLPLVELSCLRL
jgi:hypothetical protein